MDFAAIIAVLADLQVKLADAEAFAKSKFDEGFAAGVASVPVPSEDPLQAQLDAALAKVSDMEAQIAALNAQIAGIPDMIAAAVKMEDAKIADMIKPHVDQVIADLMSLAPKSE